MPQTSLVSNTNIIWDEQLTFPQPDTNDNLPASPGNPIQRFSYNQGHQLTGTTTQGEITQTNVATGGCGASFRSDAGGMVYYQLGCGGAGRYVAGMDAMQAQLDIQHAGSIQLAAAAKWPSQFRVMWLSWLMQAFTANPDERNGLLMMPTPVARWGWPDAPVGVNNRGGWGFVGDGAGQYVYRSYDRTGVSSIREQIALPAHVITEWNLFEIVMVAAQGGNAAYTEIYFNQQLIATRNWLGALLEPYAAQEYRMMPVLSGGGAGGAGGTNFTCLVCRKGRFTRAGVEIT